MWVCIDIYDYNYSLMSKSNNINAKMIINMMRAYCTSKNLLVDIIINLQFSEKMFVCLPQNRLGWCNILLEVGKKV